MPPTETDDVTLAVVASKLDGVIDQIRDLSTKVEDRPTWQDVRRVERSWEERLEGAVKQREIVIRSQDHRISTLEGWQMWAGRIVGGTVIGAIITAIFVVKP